MKAKILILSMVAIFIATTGFIIESSQHLNRPDDPQGFYVKVAINNVPLYVEEVLLTVTIGGTLWDQQWIDPYAEGWDYIRWHAEVFTGTISAKVRYDYYGCWEAYDSEYAYFWPDHNALFTFNSYSEVECD